LPLIGWRMSALRIEDATGFAKFYSRSHDDVIHVYDDTGNVIETHDQSGELKSREFKFLIAARVCDLCRLGFERVQE
jgi:hypothetical protein